MSLRLEAAGYRYPGASLWALRGISLQLAAGEVMGVVGPDDAGKSTLCLLASGFAPAVTGGEVEGRLLIDGVDAHRLATFELALRCGLLLQNPAAHLTGLHKTTFEEIAFGPRNLGLPAWQVIERTCRVLAWLGIEHLGQRDPFQLSGGETALTALAGLLALEPGWLLLDEPVAGLDPQATDRVKDVLLRVAGAGVGLLITEHRTDFLFEVCDRVAVIDGGRLERVGPAAEVLCDAKLALAGVAPVTA